MRLVPWVDPVTNESLEQTEKKLFNKKQGLFLDLQ